MLCILCWYGNDQHNGGGEALRNGSGLCVVFVRGIGVCVALEVQHCNRRPPACFASSPLRYALPTTHRHTHRTHTHHTQHDGGVARKKNERGDVPWAVTTMAAMAADGRGNAKQHFWGDRPWQRRERERAAHTTRGPSRRVLSSLALALVRSFDWAPTDPALAVGHRRRGRPPVHPSIQERNRESKKVRHLRPPHK